MATPQSIRRKRNLEVYKASERIRQRRKRAKRRAFINSLKIECCKCGENHPVCLLFHHRDPAKKIMRIQRAASTGMRHELLLKEIAKCDVLCQNCHTKLHWKKK